MNSDTRISINRSGPTRGRWAWASVLLYLLLCFVSPLLAQTDAAKEKPPKFPEGEPASLAGFSDEARFIVIVNEERLGTIESSWESDGSFTGRMELRVAGQTVTRSTKITPGPDGRWKEAVTELPRGTFKLTRDGVDVRAEFMGRTSTFKTRRGEALQDMSFVALQSLTLRRYDRATGGRQEFPVLVMGGGAGEVTLELLETTERTIGNRDERVDKFRWSVPGADIFIYADRNGRLLLLDASVLKQAVVREGCESLLKPPAPDPLVSAAEFEVTVEKDVMVPMRDQVKLATDIYRPKGVARAPVILVRTPYKKDMMELQGRYFARRGYIYAVEDCRGRFGSQGTWEPFVHEAADGYDAVEWATKQPWSTGKVGMIGGSYVGWVQWWAASARPPHLVTIIPNVAPPDPFYNIPYDYGVFYLWGAMWWADVLESNATADASGAAMARTLTKKYGRLLKALPVIDLDKSILGKENPYWRKWIAHPTNDAYWQPANFLAKLKDLTIPVFHQSGWFDGDGIGSKLNYQAMKGARQQSQKLTLGPWGHTDTASRAGAGGREFGPAAMVDLQRDYLRWFDYWLKGRDSKVLDDPLVQIYVMESDKWLTGPSYPLPGTKFEKLYLASNGKANTAAGDGKLKLSAPPDRSPADSYTYDPGDPTPHSLAYEESEADEKRVRTVEERRQEAQGYHARVIVERQDILVYVTDPLEKDLTFAGPISAKLYASSSARDTDWFMALSEMTPKGKILPLVRGKIRARFRQSLAKPKLLKPGKVYEYTLDLWQTGVTVKKGSQLLVEIASAAFPLFSRNLNTGGHNETETKYVAARQTIYHDAKRPSHILLPVIPDELMATAK